MVHAYRLVNGSPPRAWPVWCRGRGLLMVRASCHSGCSPARRACGS